MDEFYVDKKQPGFVRGGFYDESGGMLVGRNAELVCKMLNDYIKLKAENQRLTRDIQIMVEKAADKHRPAYDEQQRRIMTMEDRIRELEDIKVAAIYFYEMWCDGSVDDEAEAAEKLAALLPGEGE